MARTVNEIQQEWKQLRQSLGDFTCHIDNKIRELEKREAELDTAENLVESTYNRGKEDGRMYGEVNGWGLAKLCMVPREAGGVIPEADLEKIFPDTRGYAIFKRYTLVDVKEKISAYMDRIQIGDEVIAEGNVKYVVTSIIRDSEDTLYSGIDGDGHLHNYFSSDIEKTGNHCDIQNILSQLEGGREW